MTTDLPKFKKLKLLDELLVIGSSGFGRNPKVIYKSLREDEHITVMVKDGILDIHKKDEKTGKYISILQKPLIQLEAEISHIILNQIKEINPADPEYAGYFVLIIDEEKRDSLLEKAYKFKGKKVELSKIDVEKIPLENFSVIIPMSKVIKQKFAKAFVLHKNGDIVGGLNFAKDKYYFSSFEKIKEELDKIFGFEKNNH